jgi:ribosomal protein L37E
MQKSFGTYSIQQHADAMVCRRCGEAGKIVWDDVTRLNAVTPELAAIDGPFYERLSRKPPYPIELVCRTCGGVAVTAYPSTALHAREKYN